MEQRAVDLKPNPLRRPIGRGEQMTIQAWRFGRVASGEMMRSTGKKLKSDRIKAHEAPEDAEARVP